MHVCVRESVCCGDVIAFYAFHLLCEMSSLVLKELSTVAQ